MKVQWVDFAKRRKLKLSNFMRSLSYDEYVVWCRKRSVIPVDADEYISINPNLDNLTENETKPQPEVKNAQPNFVKKELSRLRKSDLIQLAADNNLLVQKSMTKRQLVTALLNMNK